MSEQQRQDNYDDHADALEAMANGTHESPSDQNQEPDETQASEAIDQMNDAGPTDEFAYDQAPPTAGFAGMDNEAVFNETTQEGQTPLPNMPVGAEQAPLDKRKRQVAYSRRQRHHQQHQMRKVMIPVLLVTGVVLLIIGGLSVYMWLNEGEQMVQGMDTTSAAGNAKWFAIASFPLAVILLIGAAMFRRDVKRHEDGQ